MAPIFLPIKQATQSSDDAGVLITKTVLQGYTPGPYTPALLPAHLNPPDNLLYVPPLTYFCLKALIPNVDLIDLGDFPRMRFHSPSHATALKSLIAFFRSDDMRAQDMVYVDPRVWGALIQTYASLPACFGTYVLPLSDTHLTLLQGIRSTADFTLLTVLDLASCRHMSDDTIGALKPLTNLCVLDVSGTMVGSWGVRKLAMCLGGSGAERRGPWRVRVWSLRDCEKIDDAVVASLSRFPLLSVVDLRDTAVTSSFSLTGFTATPPPSHNRLYFPTPPLEWIPALCEIYPQSRVFETDPLHSPPHVLHINRLRHTNTHFSGLHSAVAGTQHIGAQDLVVTLHPSGRQALDTTHGLEQAAELEIVERRREAAYLRAVERRENMWPFGQPERRWYDDDENRDGPSNYGTDYGSDYGSSDYGSSDYGSDYGSDYDSDDSDDDGGDFGDMGPFDLGDMGGPFAEDEQGTENDSKGAFTSPEPPDKVAQNEVAALVSARDAAELEARRFYAKSTLETAESTLRLRGGALPVELRLLAAQGERHTPVWPPPWVIRNGSSVRNRRSHKPPLPDANEDHQRNFMFFREPPSFDCIPDVEAVVGYKRKNSDKEVISVKRRKASAIICDSSQMLRNRRRTVPHANSRGLRNNMEHGSGDVPGSTAASSTSRSTRVAASTEKSLNPPAAQVSMNPFLAKKKVPSQRLSPKTATIVDPPPSMTSSAAPTLPKIFAAATNKPRLTAQSRKTVPQKGGGNAQTRNGKDKDSRGAKEVRGFDMKAWVTQGAKKT